MKFTDLPLSSTMLKALEKKWFEEPSPIQAACIPLLLDSDKDVIGQAQTGTGKTAAFGIPVIEQVDTSSKHVQSLVLAPTRELAIQVAEEMRSFTHDKKLRISLLYGWASVGQQLWQLRQGPQIVVGTPGRVIDMINRGKLIIKELRYFILDEADEMLNMGFLEDIEEILWWTNPDKQMLFFSATMPRAILSIAKKFMQPDFEIVKVKAQQLTTTNTEQIYFEVRERDKTEALTRIIDSEEEFYAIVFCRTKRECDQLAGTLQARWYLTDAIHGDLEQRARERVLKKFKAKKTMILVATDVAARGIDVDDLTHVVNYHIPQDPESYTHRIGRTWRAGKKGIAITMITPAEWKKLAFIERKTKTKIEKQLLPSVDQVIENKKQYLYKQVQDAVESDLAVYKEFVWPLLSEYSMEDMLAAFAKLAFQEQLEANSYKDIDIIQNNPEATGTTRLFIARGRSHGYAGPRELIDYLVQEADINPKDINDVRVLEEFSFVTCAFLEAEVIIDAFRRKPWRSLVSKARDKNKWGGWWRRGGWSRRPSARWGRRTSNDRRGWSRHEWSRRRR